MARSKGVVDKFKPVRGLITEANEGNFPEDAAYDLDNIEIDKLGRAFPRLGMGFEVDSPSPVVPSFTASMRSTGVYSTYLWKVVDADDTADVRVIQTGALLTFLVDSSPLGGQTPLLEVDLSQSPYTIGKPISSPCQFAYGAGVLIITCEQANPLVIEVSSVLSGTAILTASPLNLQIRTRELVEPFDTGSNYGSTLQPAEEFNLRNSGWEFNATTANDREGNSSAERDPLAYYRTQRGVYPSHNTLYNAMKLSSAKEIAGLNAFSPWEDLKISFGDTIPPLGRFVHSAYSFNSKEILENTDLVNGGTAGIIGDNGTIQWSINNRPTCCAFLNGHVLYGDIDQNNKARILVSQLAKDVDSLSRCYQSADPTAEEVNDLVATDGFVSRPIGMGKPLAMREVSKGVLVFCTNGVWVIRGTGGPFSAVDFTVDKLDEVKFNSPNSVQVVGNSVVFATESGIQTIAPNDFGELGLNDITRDTIKELYLSYGSDRINRMIACYVKEQNYIYWLVPDVGSGDGHNVLILNLDLGGFFTYSFGTGDRPALLLPMAVTNTVITNTTENVTTTSGEVVTTSLGEPVTIDAVDISRTREEVLFLTAYTPSGGSVTTYAAMFNSASRHDWWSLGDAFKYDYPAFIEFAYNYPQSMIGGIQAPYIHSYFEQARADGTGASLFPVPDIEYYRVQQGYYQILEEL